MTPWDLSNADVVAAYDTVPLWSSIAASALLETLPLAGVRTALDIGCGTGTPWLELRARLGPSARVVGIDPWFAGLVRARHKSEVWHGSDALLAAADGLVAPFPDGRFDLTVSCLTINNTPSPQVLLREMRRLTRQDGRMALATNLQGTFASLYGAIGTLLAPADLDRLAAHVDKRPTVARLTRMAEAAGWRIERVVESDHRWRFADGAAVLAHPFLRLGFEADWRAVVGEQLWDALRQPLIDRLDSIGDLTGAVSLEIPTAVVIGVPE
ncbi:MAG: class I SAM-dependent methyltransferase [Alphaproteobacteria bacterium]|nr:class I SAM-dependent methyltransferase [Alphaproteobacteria bacterium]